MSNSLGSSSLGLGKVLGYVLFFLILIVILIINLLPFFDSQDALMDFGSFYASGLKLQNGENPYDPNSEYIFEINFTEIQAGGKMVNLNPPISVVLFRMLSQFEPHRALAIWQIISALLYAGSILLLGIHYRSHLSLPRFVWAFMLAGFWHTIILGQIYILLLAFAVIGWIALQRRQFLLAGVMIGLLIAVKPNFAIWSLFLLVAGYAVTFVASLATALLISFIPLVFYGSKIYMQWLDASALSRETLIMPGNNSILGLTSRFGDSSMLIGIALSAVLVVVLLVLLKRSGINELEPPEQASALGILASILASPISWTGYTILLLPIFFSLRRWSLPVVVSAAILSVPFAIVLQLHQTSFLNFVIFGWLYGWAILLLFIDRIRTMMLAVPVQTAT